eukprot:GHVN01084543.1.p1 GENE.GHVN01084543.1~~GHVN01084543.1.p1  ORF type:complete len:204 (-),score=34.91 GHVN01084543.1:563-1174(-)
MSDPVSILKALIDPNAQQPGWHLEYFHWIPGPTWYPEKDQRYIYVEEDGSSDGTATPVQQPEEEAPQLEIEESQLQTVFEAVGAGRSAISPEEAGQVARELGFAPSEEDIENIRESVGENVNYEALQKFLQQVIHQEDSVEHLIKFFAHFDADNQGVLPKQAVSHLLTTFGEPLTPECVSTALKDQPDPVPYRDFVQFLLDRN